MIPEKTQQVKKYIIPAVYLRVAFILSCIAAFFIAFMIYDYVNVMQQLTENKRLQVENRQLKQQLQSFTNKLQNIESALERIQTYTAKLRIITNNAGESLDLLKKRTGPDATGIPMDDHSPTLGNPKDNKNLPEGSAPDPKIESMIWKEAHTPSRLLASNRFSDFVQSAQNQKKENAQKNLSDLAKEDEERESESLRDEFGKLNQAFEKILQHAVNTELDVQGLYTTIGDKKDILDSTPTLRPTGGWITSGFGVRNSPYTSKLTMHEGLDVANHVGSPVLAPAAGVVAYAAARPGYGNLLTIDHGYGIQTQYGHIARFYVRVGDKIKRGQKVAAVGNTGRSTGPHVHYEVRVNGVPVNPKFYVLED